MADHETIGALVAGVLAVLGTIELVVRRVRSALEVIIPASAERARVRNQRARRPRRDEWPDDETTDLHELMEREEAHRRKRRITRRHERSPRPGTHHDREG